ncbi:UDP-3-O-(3-hydroxymyristoyl)glucosamine N-acyltransferase [Gemmatimonas sp.]|uniref:UDP-3-O-(3-hydroxymyristoyl)glucosamine N-acyltransferase n=1 Tax=Gemmatimonas sp. TaxID=1962908 RepID=UPI0037BE3BF1
MSGELSSPQAVGGDGQTPITAAAVATLVGGRLIGDPSIVVEGIAPLDRAGAADLSVFSDQRYAGWFARSHAGVVLLSPAFEDYAEGPITRIVVDKPMDALVGLLARFHRPEPRASGVHTTAVVAPTAVIGDGVTIDAYAVIGDSAVIGARSWISAGAKVGAGSVLGVDVRLHPNAVVYPFTELGDRVVLHSGAQVGREGFGFVPRPDGPARIPHVGRCVLEHDVEIGANSCVDRGSVDDTIIGAGTKVDNLVQIAHNVRVGRFCFFASHVGIAGSSRIGDGVQMGGQSGMGNHFTVGSGATIAARAGVISDVPAKETWSGFPARPHREQMRTQAALVRLAKLIRPLERLLARDEANGADASSDETPQGTAS